MHNTQSGFALPELLVAVTILALTFASIFGAMQLAKKAIRVAADRAQAAFILEETNEALRHIRDESWGKKMESLKLGAMSYCIDFGASNYGLTEYAANVLRLQFDETAGATIFTDDSTEAADGTCVGACPQSGVVGQFGKATRFANGINDAITVMHPIALTQTEYTIEAWVNPSDTVTRNIIARTDAAGPLSTLSHTISSQNGFFSHSSVDGTGTHSVTAATPYTPGMWYHVIGTAKNGGMMKLYVDGVEAGAPNSINTLSAVGDRYNIGGSTLSASDFYGDVDAVAIYNRELSQYEIEERYAAGPPCRLVDGKFSRLISFGNACRNNINQDINSFATTPGGSVCGNGTVDADTKIATTTLRWQEFIEESAIYLPNIFRN